MEKARYQSADMSKLLVLALNEQEEKAIDKIIMAISDCIQLEPIQVAPVSILSFPGLEIRQHQRRVLRDGKDVSLTRLEYNTLVLLASNPDIVLTRTQIFEAVWNMDSDSCHSSVVNVICSLRKKIEPDSKKPTYIKTVLGVGYKFDGSVNKFVFLEINGSFLVRIRIWKFLSKRSVFMPVAKEQIRQIISENNLSSVTDVYALLRDSFKDILQELMEAELDATLGYEKNRKGDLQTDNKRNGHSPKNLKSQYGEFQIDVPRDRNGEFEPKLIPKYQRDISGIEEKVISLYARGMSTRDIHDQLNDLYGIELSAEMVSKITDKILPQVKEWQSRPLNPVYPFVFMDCIHYKVREDGRIVSRAAYVVLGVTAEGYKEILSITVGANETSKFWLGMLNDLHNRGVKDVLFFCVDGLPGFKEAIQAVFPKAEIQRCVIHMLRNSFKYVSYKDLKKFASDFKAVYNAPNESAALSELENIKEMWGKKYPYAISNWENNWEDVSSFFQFPDDIRRIMYTTNIIEGLNRQYRKVTKTKSVFPSDTSLEKMLYLASQNVTKKWTQRYRNWDQVLNQLIVLYGERLTEYL